MDQQSTLSRGGVRVLIAHDVRLMREGLASLLRQRPEFTVINPAAEPRPFQPPQEERAVDVVLLPALPTADEVAKWISDARRSWSGVKVVVLGVPESASEMLSCIEAGASACLTRDDSLERLVDTILMVYRGEVFCAPDIVPMLFERIASLARRARSIEQCDLTKLTQRELQVLQLVADGMSNKEIASCLKLELQSVKNHVHRILEKLSVRNRREASFLCSQAFSEYARLPGPTNGLEQPDREAKGQVRTRPE